MLMDEIRHDALIRFQRLYRMNLIISHQKAVAFDIGTKDGSEFSGNLIVVGHA
jgi:hypothetical protein